MQIDFDWLRRHAQCVEVGKHWVFFGEGLADSDEALVVMNNDIRDDCYYCCMATQFRLIHPVRRADGRPGVMEIDACCRVCYQWAAETEIGADFETRLAAVAQGRLELGFNADKDLFIRSARARAGRRLVDHVALVVQARRKGVPPPRPRLVPTDTPPLQADDFLARIKEVLDQTA